MRVELVVNADGKIISAVEQKEPPPPLLSESGQSKPSAVPTLRTGPGQQHHVFTLSDELAGMSLREVLQTCRFVSDQQGARLERK